MPMKFNSVAFLICKYFRLCTPCPRENAHLLFFLWKNWPILIIFGTLNPEKTWHEHLTDLSTWPVRCSHFALGNPKRSFLTVILIHNSDYLCYLRRKQTIIHLPIPPENVTSLTCELQNFFYLTEGLLHFSNIGGSEESQLWVVVGSSEKNRLWCVATGMSGKQCPSKCLEWPPSALIRASSLFRRRSVT